MLSRLQLKYGKLQLVHLHQEFKLKRSRNKECEQLLEGTQITAWRQEDEEINISRTTNIFIGKLENKLALKS